MFEAQKPTKATEREGMTRRTLIAGVAALGVSPMTPGQAALPPQGKDTGKSGSRAEKVRREEQEKTDGFNARMSGYEKVATELYKDFKGNLRKAFGSEKMNELYILVHDCVVRAVNDDPQLYALDMLAAENAETRIMNFVLEEMDENKKLPQEPHEIAIVVKEVGALVQKARMLRERNNK